MRWFRRWDGERAKVEEVCDDARQRGFSAEEIRSLRRTARHLARTHPFHDAGHHAEVILCSMLDECRRRAYGRRP